MNGPSGHPATGVDRRRTEVTLPPPTGETAYRSLFIDPEMLYRLERHVTTRAWAELGAGIPDPTRPLRRAVAWALEAAERARLRLTVWADR